MLVEVLERLVETLDEYVDFSLGLSDARGRREVREVWVGLRMRTVVFEGLCVDLRWVWGMGHHTDAGHTSRKEVAAKEGWGESMRGEDLIIQGRQGTGHANLVVFSLQDALAVGLKQLREMLFQVLIVLFPLFNLSLEGFLAHLKKRSEEIYY